MSTPALSIIIPAHNEAHRLRETILAIERTTELPYEAIVVDDASTDGCASFLDDEPHPRVRLICNESALGVAGARNRGADEARAPVVLFMDAHCYPEPGAIATMLRALYGLGRGLVVPAVAVHGAPANVGFGMTLAGPDFSPVWLPQLRGDPYPVPIACGCAQMFFRAWFDQIGRYDRMRTYGVEDLEISLRSWLLGGPVLVVPRASIAHYFRTATTCSVTWPDVIHNALRMARLHFDGDRLDRIERYWAAHPARDEAVALLRASNLDEQRARFDRRRRRSADWYCETFGIGI
jgi:glycosyltransferase involved in cell wall biosynthesis